MSGHHITIQWSIDTDPEIYMFSSKDQLDQFMFGVMECADNIGVPDIYEISNDSREE